MIDKSDKWGSWWHGPGGIREVLELAWPLFLSTASWTLMTFVDRVYLTNYSTTSIAASMPAGMLHYTLMCLPLGLASYVNTFVAQFVGANRREEVGRVVWQGVFLGICSIPIFLALIPFARSIFMWADHEPKILEEEVIYFRVLAYGAGGAVIAAALSSFFTGLGKTRVVLWVDVAVALFNIVFDYLWIFGRGGFPEWGIFGAGLATSLGQWLKVAILLAILARREYRIPFALVENCRWHQPLMMRLIHYGGPSGLQQWIETTSFTIFLLLLGRLGEHEMAATNVAFSVNSLAYLPLLGMGVAVTTLVGQHLGGARPDIAERSTWNSLLLAVGYAGLMSLGYLLIPDVFLFFHASGNVSGETAGPSFELLRADCHILLRFVGAYCLMDAVHVVFVSAIKGAGDTRFVLATTMLIAPIPVVLAWWGTRQGTWTLMTFWIVLTVWICVLGVVYAYRFLTGPWRKLRVID